MVRWASERIDLNLVTRTLLSRSQENSGTFINNFQGKTNKIVINLRRSTKKSFLLVSWEKPLWKRIELAESGGGGLSFVRNVLMDALCLANDDMLSLSFG